MDGLGTGAAINGGGVSGYGQLETAQEVVMTTAGGLGEAEVGGPVVNLIPQTGGNTFQHHFYGSGMTGGMQSSNYTQALKDLGVASSAAEDELSVGHQPVERRADQEGSAVVLLSTTGTGRAGTSLPGMYYNKNAGDSTKWTLRAGLQPSGQQRQRSGHASTRRCA